MVGFAIVFTTTTPQNGLLKKEKADHSVVFTLGQSPPKDGRGFDKSSNQTAPILFNTLILLLTMTIGDR